MDNKTKQFLIKAMIEGLRCHLPTVESIEKYILELTEIVEENEHIKSTLEGDHEGIFINDSRLNPYAMIRFGNGLITFGLLVPEPELTDQQSKDFGRIVLACVSTLAKMDMLEQIAQDKPAGSRGYGTASNIFKIPKIGIIY